MRTTRQYFLNIPNWGYCKLLLSKIIEELTKACSAIKRILGLEDCLKKNLATFLSVTAVIGFSANAFAVTSNPDAGALQKEIQKDAPDVFTAPLPDVSAPSAESLNADEGVQVLIKGVRLEGVHLVDVHELEDALNVYLNKSYNIQALQKLVDVVTAIYSQHGLVVQAYLPEQNINEDSVLVIRVVEAKLGDVSVENKDRQARLSDKNAASYITAQNPVGSPLNANLVTKGLALINELSGIQATSALEAGQKEGETNVHLSLRRTSLLDARVEIKNGGSRSTGVAQAVVSATLNSPLNMGDQASFYGLYSEGSSFNQATYALPIGYRGLRLAMTANYLDYENVGQYKVNGGFGDAWVLGANLSYPIKRSQSTNANLTVGVEEKGYLNRNLATRAVNSSYQIQNLNLGGNLNRYDGLLGGGVTNISGNIIFGHLDIDGETPTNYLVANGQRYVPSTFSKIAFNASRVQLLPVDGTQLMVNISGQLSADNLSSSEQFYLGGPYGVRAYPVAQAGGSQGILASVELQKQLPQRVTASVFFDAGSVQQYKHTYEGWQGDTGASNTYQLYGAGVGLKWNLGKFNLSGLVAWKLGNNPLKTVQNGVYVNRDNDGYDTSPRAWLNASYSF